MDEYVKFNRDHCFFCYNMQMAKYIIDIFGIKPITIAINTRSKDKFALFPRSEKLQTAINDYNK